MANPKKGKDGRYRSRIYIGKDENGKKKFRNVYATSIPELKQEEAKIRHQLGKGLDMLSQRDSFASWADGWLDVKEAAPISDKQKDNYRRSVKMWKDGLTGYEIGEVRADDIERVLVGLQKDGYAQRTINLHRSCIRQIMRRAVGRVIAVNPEQQVELTEGGKPEEKRRALTDEEQQWIWDTPHRAQPVAVIMMLSGLRRGELAALTWADVDTKAGTIRVNKSIEYQADRTPVLKNLTKTAAGMRTVDIPKKLCDYLDQMPKDNVLVIPSASGGVMTESAWVKLWRSYMRVLNEKYGAGILADQDKPGKPGPKTYEMTIPPITLHWLRHTFCTIMYKAGVDVVQACAQMGHASVTTTLRIYTHLDAQHKRKAADKMDIYLSGGAEVAQKQLK